MPVYPGRPATPTGSIYVIEDDLEPYALQASVDAIAPDDGARAVGKAELMFTVSDYGPAGDGITDDSAELNAAYAAVVAAGGGVLELAPGRSYRMGSPLVLDGDVSVTIRGYGATLVPSGSYAVMFAAGSTATDLTHTLQGVSIDGEPYGGNGVQIVDHFSACLRDVKIRHCTIGVQITDDAQWSESTVLDNVVTDWCEVGVDVQTTGGTGSFGYFHWGFVGIYNVPDDGVGFRVGAGAFLYHSTIGRMVVQIQGNDATGIQVDGTVGNNSVWHTVVESSASPYDTRVGLRLGEDASVTGIDWHNYFQGTWLPSRIVNPGDVPFELRDGAGYQWRGRALGEGFNLIGFGVFGDSFDRVAVRPDRIMLGPGNAQMDTAIVRHGEAIGGLATGHSWQVDTGQYDSGHLIMGGYHLWVDGSGRLRIKSGAPTSSTDGTVVGAQS